MKHVMLDLETLGTTADAVILSIAAVRFDLDSDAIDDRAFYTSVDIDSNLAQGRRIQEDTLLWWMQQSEEARRVFFEPKLTLSAALQDLRDWFGPDADHTHVWSNGADFDLPMLAHAFWHNQLQCPWRFWMSRCVRTYRALPQAQGLKLSNQHHALHDAINQARLVQAIQQRLTQTKDPS